MLVEVAIRTSSSFADALVLYATWRVTGDVRKLARRLDVDVSFASLVLADGAPAHSRYEVHPSHDALRPIGTLYFWCVDRDRCPFMHTMTRIAASS